VKETGIGRWHNSLQSEINHEDIQKIMYGWVLTERHFS
jgi:hypothetical protein